MATLHIVVVGPCAAGKTTLIANLEKQGITARQLAQEHSFVPDMWQRLSQPDALIYLDCTYPVSMQRKPLNWSEREFEEQKHRLRHARKLANLYIHTDDKTPEEVVEIVVGFIQSISEG
ncbi:MAG: hypothetical protein AB1345_13830 [Chloroflexota bacterium]